MKFQASKKPDLPIIERVRHFLIKLLAGPSMQVMVNIKIVDGVMILDGNGGLVHACAFIGAHIELPADGWYEKLGGNRVEGCHFSHPNNAETVCPPGTIVMKGG